MNDFEDCSGHEWCLLKPEEDGDDSWYFCKKCLSQARATFKDDEGVEIIDYPSYYWLNMYEEGLKSNLKSKSQEVKK